MQKNDTMKPFEVKVGGFYVNDKQGVVREIIHDYGNGYILWRAYYLSTREPRFGYSAGSKDYILRWSDREADWDEPVKLGDSYRSKAEEITRKQEKEIVDSIMNLFESILARIHHQGVEVVDRLLGAMNDELLLKEVCCRLEKITGSEQARKQINRLLVSMPDEITLAELYLKVLMEKVLYSIPDELILAELRRRGLKITE